MNSLSEEEQLKARIKELDHLVDELTMELDLKKETLIEYRTNLTALHVYIRSLERAELIHSNREDVLPAAQEAAHYNWLDDKIRQVEQHNANLTEENSKLRQALKFTTKAAVHLFQPEKPLEKGLPPFHYHTLTYEGDLELIENTKLAMELIKDEDNL